MDIGFDTVMFIAEILVAIFVGIIYIKSRIPEQTIDQQNKLISALNGRLDALAEENKELHKQHVESQKAIAELQDQIKVYKELPLQEISNSLKALEVLPLLDTRVSETTVKALHDIIKSNKKKGNTL
jgi:uncharacterized membrane-anchored protein YhcB (DUF1043 family)